MAKFPENDSKFYRKLTKQSYIPAIPGENLIQLDLATIVDDHVWLVGEIGEVRYLGST